MTVIPTSLLACEQWIINRLKGSIDDAAIEPFPDDPKAFKLLHQRGAYLVALRSASYTPDGGVHWSRALQWDVHIVSKQLSGHDGAYRMLEASMQALIGHRPPGFTAFTPERERFIARGEGVWIYAQTFATETTVVQADDADQSDGPLLERTTAVSEFGTTIVP